MPFEIDFALVTLTVFVISTLAFVLYERFVLSFGLPAGLGLSLPATPDLRPAMTAATLRLARAAPARPRVRKLVRPRLLTRRAPAALRAAVHVPPAAPQPQAPAETSRPTVSGARQLERLSQLVNGEADRAAVAQSLHRDAGQQIDLTAYAVQNLLNELATVMPSLAAAKPNAPAATVAPSPLALAA